MLLRLSSRLGYWMSGFKTWYKEENNVVEAVR